MDGATYPVLTDLHTIGYPRIRNTVVKPVVGAPCWYRFLRVDAVILAQTHEERRSVEEELLLREIFAQAYILEDSAECVFSRDLSCQG